MTAKTRSPMPFTVAISAAESPDSMAFGLSDGHMRDMIAGLATHVMAADMDIAYAGNLRHFGLVGLLFDLVIRYTAAHDLGVRRRVTNHLAWPMHIEMPIVEIEGIAAEVEGWPGQPEFEPWTGDDLRNGLSREENEALANTPFLGQVMVLVLRGLYRIRRERMLIREEVAHA